VCRPRHSTPVSGSSHSLGPTNRSSGNAVETSPQIANSKSLSDPVIVDGSASHSPEKEPQQDVTVNLDGVDGYGEHSSLVSAQVPEKQFVVRVSHCKISKQACVAESGRVRAATRPL
jgi:hypothetical protein